jgi:DNA-binding response OmpR family regulator
LVEDDESLRDAFALTLRRHGYRVVTAEDGKQAEQWLAADLPDLALVDMMIPGSSGFAVTHLIQERSDGHVPVIMMSGNTSPAHRDYAFASGADVFLPKPFALAALLDAAHRLCPLPAAPRKDRQLAPS